MAIVKSDALPLQSGTDVVLSRQAIRKLVQDLGFSLVDQTKMITAASEIARNAIIYGGGGTMHWEVLSEGARKGLRLTFEDHGPGIPNIELAMSDGFTSGTGLGKGLPGARRLVNNFEIRSTVGTGTTVTITRWT